MNLAPETFLELKIAKLVLIVNRPCQKIACLPVPVVGRRGLAVKDLKGENLGVGIILGKKRPFSGKGWKLAE